MENDVVKHPKHYTRKDAMECIDEIVTIYGLRFAICFCIGNVHKYRYRAADKNGAEDIAKSDWYMNKATELMHQLKENGDNIEWI